MTELNIHSKYIDKRINDIKKSDKWKTKIIDSSHEDFIKDYSSNIFTNLVQSTFTKSYIKKYLCMCGNPSTERCHGKGEERPLLIKRALEKVWNDTTKPIVIKKIIIAFLEEHKYTSFAFKCHSCHKNEKYS